MPSSKRLVALILTWSAVSFGACSAGEDPKHGPREDAGADVGVDAGPCGPAPYNVCPPYSCYQCENQLKPGCMWVCMNYGCMECGPNGWFKTTVYCDPTCYQKPDASDAAADAPDAADAADAVDAADAADAADEG